VLQGHLDQNGEDLVLGPPGGEVQVFDRGGQSLGGVLGHVPASALLDTLTPARHLPKRQIPAQRPQRPQFTG
jgi:hypothetical protein